MINWVMTGALAALLTAELVDAWALRQLVHRCMGICPRTRSELRLLRWYAEGFDHSVAVTGWLRATCLALTVASVLCGAHPLVIVASLLLAIGAHGERYFSAQLHRRFQRVEEQRLPAATARSRSAPSSLAQARAQH